MLSVIHHLRSSSKRPCRAACSLVLLGISALLAGIPSARISSVSLLRKAGASEAEERAPSFRRDVMAVFSKAGCNSGACHGNQNGKGGFRLSLRGQEPEQDYMTLTHEYGGRRLNRLWPEGSLLLLKPAGRLPHEGGTRFREDSPLYRLLHDWVVSGAARGEQEPELVQLEVLAEPAERVILATPKAEAAASQGADEPVAGGPKQLEWPAVRLQVFAQFADGSRRDVTSLAVFESSNLLAEVSAAGMVRARQPGETTIVVRYLDQQVALPYAFVPRQDDFQAEPLPANNFIDQYIDVKLATLRINPSPVCDDATFVRRAYLDAAGMLPSPEEARAFVADTRPDKRARLVDALLGRPEFADFWALKWADILRAEEKVLDTRGVELFHRWIRDWIAEDRPFDAFVTQLLTASGSTYENPTANFYRAHRDPSTRGETVARLFLGYRLQCAKCHNHPFDRWTQDDYYNWTTLFSRIDYEIVENKRTDKFDKHEFVGEQIVLLKDEGEVKNPRSGELATARVLGGPAPAAAEDGGRLKPTAAWLTSQENAQFARVQANWIWYHLMGRGLVEPIDDFRLTNPPSHPELLEALSREFQAADFRLRPLVRRIMQSRAYQSSAEPNKSNGRDQSNYSRALVKRLPAEVLLDCQTQVVGSPPAFAGYDRGLLRAAALPGVRKGGRRVPREAGDRFLTTFGKPQRLLACECERSNETTLTQALMLIGGESLHDRLSQQDNRLARLASSDRSNEQLVTELYWLALTRPPTDEELQTAVALLSDNEERFPAVQDLAWALLNAKEFVFRH